MINEIREVIGNVTVAANDTNTNILKYIQTGKMEDSKIMAFIEKQISKGSTSKEKLIELAKNIVAKENRVQHNFKTWDEASFFAKNNNCGKVWDDLTEAITHCHVYEYK